MPIFFQILLLIWKWCRIKLDFKILFWVKRWAGRMNPTPFVLPDAGDG